MKFKFLVGVLAVGFLIFICNFSIIAVAGVDTLATGSIIQKTQTSDKVCTNGVCTLKLYAGIRNVFEDGEWKRIEDAKSLKGKGFEVVYLEKDDNFTMNVVDFNYTYVKINFSINPELKNKIVPIKVLEEGYISKTKEETGDFLTTDSFERDIYSNVGDLIKFGFNTTTIILKSADSEVLEDTAYSEVDTMLGNEQTITADLLDGTGDIAFFKFDTSIIPSDANIINATLSIYLSTGSNDPLDLWYVSNQSWREEEVDTLCGGGGPVCQQVFDMFSQRIMVTASDNSDGVYMNFTSINETLKINQLAGYKNMSYALNYTGLDPANSYNIRTKERTTIEERPTLSITYSGSPFVWLKAPLNNSLIRNQTNAFICNSTDETLLKNMTLFIWNVTNDLIMTNFTLLTGKTNSTNLTTTLNNSMDGNYTWNCEIYDSDHLGRFGDSNFTLFVDTTEPNISITQIVTTAGSQSVDFYTNTSDLHLDSCKYTIYKADGSVDGVANKSFTCNKLNTTIVSAFANYELIISSNDTLGNYNQTGKTFVVSASSGGVVGGGGGGGGVPQQQDTETKIYGAFCNTFKDKLSSSWIAWRNKQISLKEFLFALTDYIVCKDSASIVAL